MRMQMQMQMQIQGRIVTGEKKKDDQEDQREGKREQKRAFYYKGEGAKCLSSTVLMRAFLSLKSLVLSQKNRQKRQIRQELRSVWNIKHLGHVGTIGKSINLPRLRHGSTFTRERERRRWSSFEKTYYLYTLVPKNVKDIQLSRKITQNR